MPLHRSRAWRSEQVNQLLRAVAFTEGHAWLPIRLLTTASSSSTTGSASQQPQQQPLQQQHQQQVSGQAAGASPSAASQAAQAALDQGLFSIAHVPGQGRGLWAAQRLQHGQLLFTEQPLLVAPSLQHTTTVCHQCLSTRVTPRRQSAADTLPHFCSWECHAAALATYFHVESRLHLGGLAAYCKKQEEKMPLMAARLACSLMQEAMRQATHSELHQARAAWPAQLQQRAAAARFPGTRLGGAEPTPGSSSSSSRPGAQSEVSSSSSDEEGEGEKGAAHPQGGAPVKPYQSWSRADLLGDLHFLCHANVPPPAPPPWQESYQLLKGGLDTLAGRADSAAAAAAAAAVASRLDLQWYMDVLSRLHLNVFRVDAALPFTSWQDLQAAAAGSVSAAASPGSAVYLLASLFNHSCDPNVNVAWPAGTATVKFTAARDIDPGEQLTISYINQAMPVAARQQVLEFSYGFQCHCALCVEEMEPSTPPPPPT